MALEAPNLDDRRYQDIVDEAIALIPRYTPEWTDHNQSDPGITLVQLFAWMTEMMLYRFNQVPERNYIKFLELLGIRLNPARSARAELTFKLARNDVETIVVPKGTQVAAADTQDGNPLVFETEAALIALGAQLEAIQSFDGFGYSVETTKNTTPAQWFYPFGPRPREDSALLLGFNSPLDFTSEQVNLMFYTYQAGDSGDDRHCDVDLSQLPVPAMLAWEYWDGKRWELLSLDKDETRSFSQSGHIYFRGPGSKLKKDTLGNIDASLYWIRCRLVKNTYEQAPRLELIRTNTISAVQKITVRDEVLGGSDGRPQQTFQLANVPLVARQIPKEVTRSDGQTIVVKSVTLEIDEGQGFDFWQEVTDFVASGPDDPHFTIDYTTGVITFGDGNNGRIPIANPSNPGANLVAREYFVGGGKRGNVGANSLTEIQTFVEGASEVTNFYPAIGGADEETLDEAKLRAPLELKSKNRAVTAEDFESLTLFTPGVKVRRAKALPLVHPKFREAQIPGAVTVVVVPDSDSPNPSPNEATLAVVCAHLNKHRLLTSDVHVVAPIYHLVRIEADLIARPEADLAEVKRGVEEALTTYFHSLYGGEDGNGWPFGQDIFYSEVYRRVLQSLGVERVENNNLFIWLDNERQTFCRDVCIRTGELLYSDAHTIRVTYGSI